MIWTIFIHIFHDFRNSNYRSVVLIIVRISRAFQVLFWLLWGSHAHFKFWLAIYSAKVTPAMRLQHNGSTGQARRHWPASTNTNKCLVNMNPTTNSCLTWAIPTSPLYSESGSFFWNVGRIPWFSIPCKGQHNILFRVYTGNYTPWQFRRSYLVFPVTCDLQCPVPP